MSTVTIATTERDNQYVLTEYRDHIGSTGRLMAIFWFAILATVSFFILFSILSNPYSINTSSFASLDPQDEDVAGSIAFYGGIFLIFFIGLQATLGIAVFELLAAYLRLPESVIDIGSGVQSCATLVLIFILILLAFPLSKFIVAPLIIAFLRTPVGATLFSWVNCLASLLLTYISLSLALCRYTYIREFTFDKASDQLTLRCELGLPLFITLGKDPNNSNNIHFVPLWHFQTGVYDFPLQSIRSVHRYDKTPTLALDVARNVLYLPTVQCKNQQECEQILATLMNRFRWEQGQDIDARMAKEKVQLREDVLQGINTRVLPTEGEKAPLALLVASALTMVRRNQQRLNRQPDNPNLHLQLGIALLRSRERATALQHIQEALRLYRLQFQPFRATTVKQYLSKARRAA